VPEIAAKHHEKLDGTGYPNQAISAQIPIQSRMMTIADIYDALTASDRPYKKAVNADKALDIINMDVKGGKVDAQLFDLFVSSGIYKIVLPK
jgi:HD-GYP domain-containing protein (c-di-GMP phosphodiesterase class II)